MAELPILIVAFFFGAVSLAWTHAWLVVPVLVTAWLLLFVPSRTWANIRSSIAPPFRRTGAPAPAAATVTRDKRPRVLVHSR